MLFLACLLFLFIDAEGIIVYVLRARKRSSERIAMALIRSTETAAVSLQGVVWRMGAVVTVEEAAEAEEQHRCAVALARELGKGSV